MVSYLGQRTRVEFNGHDVSHLTGVSIGGMNKVFDTFQTLKDPFDHDIEISDEASGSFDFVASHKSGADQKFRELFNLILGYQDLADGDGSALATGDNDDTYLPTDANFDATEEVTYTIPRFLPVFRRVSEAGSAAATFDSTNDTAWIKFRAQGERISTLAFVIKTSTTDDHTFTVSICPSQDATGAAPASDDSLVSGMTVSPANTIAGATHNGANLWYVVTPHASWSDADRLTVGTDYWLRVTKTGGSTGNFKIALADDQQDYGNLYLDSNASISGASEQVANEAIHYIKFKQTEGLKVVVYDYIDLDETSGLKYTFNKVKLESVSPSFANKQATRATVSWTCNDWSFDEI